MKAREVALIGVLSATITAGKLVLSFIPNVEIVTFLFIVYTISFGLKRSLLVSIVFTTTEIFLYGFSIWLLVYYLIWPLLVLISSLLESRIKSEYGYAVIAGLFGLFFGLIFAAGQSLFYGLAYGFSYWIKGIPFDILHGVSNFIIMLLLFKPISSRLKTYAEKYR